MNWGYVYALICVLMWSFLPIVSRFGQSHLDNFQFLFWSNVLSLIVVGLCMLAKKGLAPLRSFSLWKAGYVCFLGGLGCGVYYLCLYFGYANGNSLEVLILQYSWPLQIILLSVVILKERLSLASWGGVGLGLFGIILVLTKGNLSAVAFTSLGISALVLAGAFCFALFSVLSKKLHGEAFAVATLLFAGGTLVSTCGMVLFSSFALPRQEELIPVLVNGALINGISYILWLLALSQIPASMAAVIVFLSPVLSAIWIVVFLGEVFYLAYAIGFVLVLASGALCLANARRSSLKESLAAGPLASTDEIGVQ